MIVIGLDVHKQTVTAVAVDEAGRPLAETTIQVGSDELLGWAAALGGERLWAVEDCRQLTRWLERQLLGVGEDLVRVPPKLTVPERRAGRTRGKSDPIDALAIAQGGATGARPEPATARRAALPRDQAAGSTIVTISSTSAADPSSGCVGTSFSSTRPTRCRYGCSAGPPIWSASAAGLPAASRSCRCDSRVSSSPAAARSTVRSPNSTSELEQRGLRDRTGAA